MNQNQFRVEEISIVPNSGFLIPRKSNGEKDYRFA